MLWCDIYWQWMSYIFIFIQKASYTGVSIVHPKILSECQTMRPRTPSHPNFKLIHTSRCDWPAFGRWDSELVMNLSLSSLYLYPLSSSHVKCNTMINFQERLSENVHHYSARTGSSPHLRVSFEQTSSLPWNNQHLFVNVRGERTKLTDSVKRNCHYLIWIQHSLSIQVTARGGGGSKGKH